MKTSRDSYEYSRQHVQERAWERYGMTLTDKDYDVLCAKARSFFLGKEKDIRQTGVEQNGDDTQYILVIPFRSKSLISVFSKKQDRVKTLLPAKSDT